MSQLRREAAAAEELLEHSHPATTAGGLQHATSKISAAYLRTAAPHTFEGTFTEAPYTPAGNAPAAFQQPSVEATTEAVYAPASTSPAAFQQSIDNAATHSITSASVLSAALSESLTQSRKCTDVHTVPAHTAPVQTVPMVRTISVADVHASQKGASSEDVRAHMLQQLLPELERLQKYIQRQDRREDKLRAKLERALLRGSSPGKGQHTEQQVLGDAGGRGDANRSVSGVNRGTSGVNRGMSDVNRGTADMNRGTADMNRKVLAYPGYNPADRSAASGQAPSESSFGGSEPLGTRRGALLAY